jgi:hypothetical protein
MAAKKKKSKESPPPASRGLDARRLASAQPPTSVETLARTIEDDGGAALALYRDPLGSHWQILAALPITAVEPTPFQRDLSEAHVARVASAIDRPIDIWILSSPFPPATESIGRRTATTDWARCASSAPSRSSRSSCPSRRSRTGFSC